MVYVLFSMVVPLFVDFSVCLFYFSKKIKQKLKKNPPSLGGKKVDYNTICSNISFRLERER